MSVRIIRADCRAGLRSLAERSVHTVISSPPYWGLRDYGIEPSIWGGDGACDHQWGYTIVLGLPNGDPSATVIRAGRSNLDAQKSHRERGYWCQRCGAWRGAFGLEPTYQMFVAHAVEIGREIWRVLRDDGTFWLNLGDCYATGAGAVGEHPGGGPRGDRWMGRDDAKGRGTLAWAEGGAHPYVGPRIQPNRMPQPNLKPKDLVGIPWRVAFALQEDGWFLRQDNIWHKPNPMPESTNDRCTKAHEYLFLLTKRERYFYDAVAIEEDASYEGGFKSAADFDGKNQDGGVRNIRKSGNKVRKAASERGVPIDDGGRTVGSVAGSIPWAGARRNKRSVWTIATSPFPEAHFATFPPAIVEPCVKAGTSERGCCPSCGRGWERVVAEVETGATQKMPDGMATYAGGHEAIHRDGREQGATGMPVMVKVTVGFYPACTCARQEPLPPYPPKPSRAKMEREHGKEVVEPKYRAAMVEWRAACKPIDERRRAMCEAAMVEIKAVPAIVLDPFGGSGTTGMVARQLQRDAVLVEINPKYAEMAMRRIEANAGMFAGVTIEEIGVTSAAAKEAAE